MITTEELKKHIEKNSDFIRHNEVVFEILEGRLMDKVMNAIRRMTVSDRAYNISVKLIPPINILRQVNNKLSQVYSEPPQRIAEETNDIYLIDYYEKYASINTVFAEANKFFNAQKVVAIEPYLDGNLPMVRVLPGHHFVVHSSDKVNPMKVTEFCKFVGDEIYIYTDEEFYRLEGNRKVSEGNNYGIIPQTYIKKTRNMLIPMADTDLLQMAVLIPSMWASVNYGINYQSHSVMYGIDVDFENIEMNPDSFLVFKSDRDKKPEIGSIKPQIDIAEVDKHILDMFNVWLESMDVRPGEASQDGGSLSGIALAIKEMNAYKNIKSQTVFFEEAEKDFWQRLKVVHNYWVDNGLVQEMPKFSDNFAPQIIFPDFKLYDDEEKEITKQISLLKSGLTSRKKALGAIYKDMTEEQKEPYIKYFEDGKAYTLGLIEKMTNTRVEE
jgi:hypothetical protein